VSECSVGGSPPRGHRAFGPRPIDLVGTMYLGAPCESGPIDTIFGSPAQSYTSALLSAIPQRPGAAARARIRLLGEPPSPIKPPSGCRFRTRCAFAQDICAELATGLRPPGGPHGGLPLAADGSCMPQFVESERPPDSQQCPEIIETRRNEDRKWHRPMRPS
jgi:oligopeptide/dipeptide ABC transporter ATP-binding protein